MTAHLPQRLLDGGNVAPVDDPFAVVENDQRDDVAMVALAPFLACLPVGADVSFYMGDFFAGEITFHLGAVGSAAADEDGDGWVAGRDGWWGRGCGTAKEGSGKQE